MKNEDKPKIIKFLTDNLDKIKKHFKDRKWSVDDFKQTEWTKHTKYNEYHLGNQKNYEG